MDAISDRVLIETYWNVKGIGKEYYDAHAKGINRNILECKGSKQSAVGSFDLRINRNILECKVKLISYMTILLLVLIETYWNVKIHTLALIKVIWKEY